MPVGQPPEDEDAPPEEASVVDPKVLAERRARRAEMAEESLLSRVNRAEQDRVLLATRLAEAEHELATARKERASLTQELDRRERELRAAEQREFAEQQRRVEAEDEAVQARRTTRGDVDALRRQVQASEQRIDELGHELEVARREAAEAARAAAQERARAERRTAGGGERRAILAEQEQDLRRRVAEVERLEQQAREVSEKLDRRRESLESEIVALQSFADELDGTLRTERDRRLAVEAELAAERERAAAEVTLLQHELDRRTRERDAAAAERNRLTTTLEAVRAQLAAAHDTIAQRDRMLAEAERLRAGAGDLEERLAQERLTWRAREEELLIQLEAQRRRHGDDLLEREAALRTELELQRREFDRKVSDLEATASGLRAQALGAADELEVRLAAERAAKDAAIAALQEEKDRLGEQRSLSMQEVAAERDRLAEQRRTHEETAARERLELEARRREADEIVHRAQAEAERTVANEMRRAADQLAAVREEARLARREAAEATASREALEEELRRRVQLEDQVRGAIAELRGRLQDADAQDAARAERDAAVEALVTELVDTAASLRAGFEQELAETERRLRGQVDEERARFAAELTSMEERIGTLRSQLGGAADELREQLDAERAARLLTESELRAERERGRDDRTLAAEAARVQAELERELTTRILAEAAAQEALEAVQAELDHLRGTQAGIADAGLFAATAPPVPVPAPVAPPEPAPEPATPARFDTTGLDAETASLIGDLQAAADRLRAQVAAAETDVPAAPESGPEPVVEADPVPDPDAEPLDAVPGPEPALETAAVAGGGADVAPVAVPTPEPIDEAGAIPVPAPATAPARAGAPLDDAGSSVLIPGAATGPPAAWLGPALAALAATDPALVTRLLPAVLAAHARRAGRDLAYDVVADDGAGWHVRLRGGVATVERREGGTGGEVDFALHGPLAALAVFAAGGTGRRPADVRVSGRRRRLRKLVKELRTPIGLADVAAAGGEADPRDLLVLLTAQLDAGDLTGHRFTVAYELTGAASDVLLHVAVDGGARVGEGPAGDGATATVTVAGRALAALLGGGPPPPGERATVRGSARSAELLHHWFDQVQGVRR